MTGSSTVLEDSAQFSYRFPEVFSSNLHWIDPVQGVSQPSPLLLDALCDSSSLTEILVAQAGASFRVQRLEENWCAISDPSLRKLFGPLCAEHGFWSRKVLLHGRGEPWVLAHTLMPKHAAYSHMRQVLTLGDKPLGRFLFSHQQLCRANLQIAQVDENMWGRRSVFYLFSKPIMVAEFFTPEYLQRIQAV